MEATHESRLERDVSPMELFFDGEHMAERLR